MMYVPAPLPCAQLPLLAAECVCIVKPIHTYAKQQTVRTRKPTDYFHSHTLREKPTSSTSAIIKTPKQHTSSAALEITIVPDERARERSSQAFAITDNKKQNARDIIRRITEIPICTRRANFRLANCELRNRLSRISSGGSPPVSTSSSCACTEYNVFLCVTYMSMAVHRIVGELNLVEEHRLRHPMRAQRRTVGMHVDATVALRLGTAGGHPLRVRVLVPAFGNRHHFDQNAVVDLIVQAVEGDAQRRKHAAVCLVSDWKKAIDEKRRNV